MASRLILEPKVLCQKREGPQKQLNPPQNKLIIPRHSALPVVSNSFPTTTESKYAPTPSKSPQAELYVPKNTGEYEKASKLFKKKVVITNIFTAQLSTTELTQSGILTVLNKLSPDNLGSSSRSIEALLKTKEDLSTFIDLIFKKSINEQKFASLYVQFINEIKRNIKIYERFIKSDNVFVPTLVTKAQEFFNKIPVPKEPTSDMSPQELVDMKNDEEIERVEYLGTIRLIGELYKQGAVIVKLPLICLRQLYEIKTDLTVQAITILLKSVWKNIKSEDEDGLRSVIDDVRKLEDVSSLAKRTHILVDLCLEEIESNWTNAFIERSQSTPIKQPTSSKKETSILSKYAPPSPVKPRAQKGSHRDSHRIVESARRDEIRTPVPQTPSNPTGKFSTKSVDSFIKGNTDLFDLLPEIKIHNACGEVIKACVTNYETCNNAQLSKIVELMKELCIKDNEGSIIDVLTEIKGECEGLEAGANDVFSAIFVEMITNKLYKWEDLCGYLDNFEDIVISKFGVRSPLYICSRTVLEIEKKKKQDLFCEIQNCNALSTSLFYAWMRSAAGGFLNIPSGKSEYVKTVCNDVISFVKAISNESDEKVFKQTIPKIWNDPDDSTNETIKYIEESLNKVGLYN
ncbi:MIF4G domain-containing protein [Entamoeba marina]